jgi:hypothetical protein
VFFFRNFSVSVSSLEKTNIHTGNSFFPENDDPDIFNCSPGNESRTQINNSVRNPSSTVQSLARSPTNVSAPDVSSIVSSSVVRPEKNPLKVNAAESVCGSLHIEVKVTSKMELDKLVMVIPKSNGLQNNDNKVRNLICLSFILFLY